MSIEFIILLVVSNLYISYLIYLNNQVINVLNLKHTAIDNLLFKEKNSNIKKSFLNLEFNSIVENFENENKSFKLSILFYSIVEGAVYTFCPGLFFIILSIFIFALLFSSFTMLKHFIKLKYRLSSLLDSPEKLL